MDAISRETTDFRDDLFTETGLKMKIPAAFIEKDFWVCWTLKQLYSLPALDGHLIFKGGTSLSKVFNVIHRFSEDIDLTLDRRLFGFGDELNPNNATSNKKRKKFCEAMVVACRDYIQNTPR